ncbi:FAD-binding dehydrogenase [Membranicola marinus]|uniref:FAD-binding dehydrogenase n=2 Tax=Membranihabitans marinus TaxID=1227546 RepID=A0A953HSM6_9BACT|nr:FAD-binding dehydrogenase [Membranihabitans marinus]MBY5960203.1 FAD-binding dehydrogenase [Membranihabitans marinus]
MQIRQRTTHTTMPSDFHPHAIIIGAGIAGLTAALEIVKKGKKVLLLDQESEQNLGGQAFWSLGGLFFINSPLQRRMGIKDSLSLARQDWMGTAGFDRKEDHWPRKWAEAYLEFAAGPKYQYVRDLGISFFPVVSWAERGDGTATGHGNSVPRFHIPWGTGTGIIKPFIKKAYAAQKNGLLRMKFRHQVTNLVDNGLKISGVQGHLLAPATEVRGQATNRQVIGSFEFQAPDIVVSSGGIGANLELVRKNWPTRLGTPPKSMVSGVPDYVDGKMIGVAELAGANVINRDRMWHYTEGIKNYDPIWSNHGIRILPGPSSLWFTATGQRLPPPYLPGFDTLGTLEHIRKSGHDYSWFILTQSIIKKEFALSGSEQNPDLTNRDYKLLLKRAFGSKATGPVEAFKKRGVDFVVADRIEDLVTGMNNLAGNSLLNLDHVRDQISARDQQMDHKYSKDLQVTYLRGTRNFLGDKLFRTAKPHKILDPKNGPLIAVRLHILTRKTLGGIETNLDGQVLQKNGTVLSGLYAAGEASGFGGGGYHGYRALEGTFLGGCIFSGMKAGRHIGKK